MALDITRTRSKKYVGVCGLGECDYLTSPIRFRIDCSLRLRDHVRKTHGFDPVSDPQPERTTMKQPGKELPPQEKLGDYVDHLVVFADAREDRMEQTQFGAQDIIRANVSVFVDGAWKSLGDTPVFWSAVQAQIREAIPDPLGGVLTQGTERNKREWAIRPTNAAADKKALVAWEKKRAEQEEPF